MVNWNAHESRRPVLRDIELVPATASLPAKGFQERRNLAARHALVRRIQDEFTDLPGLSLTLAQAAKLFGIAPEACSRLLMRLSDRHAVLVRSDGRYVLRVGES